MKVTTNIREYITKEVAKIIGEKVNPYTEQAKVDKKMIHDFEEELRAAQKVMLDKFIEDHKLMDDGWHGIKPFVASTTIPSFFHAVTPTMLKAKEWDEEHQKFKARKTREIIAKLELGANRQELEAMLAELRETD